MSGVDRAAAKAKELATRRRLGPRIGHPKNGGHRATLAPMRPRATGAASPALRNDQDSINQ